MLTKVFAKPVVTARTPIADYGLIGNGFTCTLISASGSADWLCWPAFDSSSLLGALLDAQHGGRFVIVPMQPILRIDSHYLGISFVMETDVWAEEAHIRRTEFMAGSALEDQALLRSIEVVEGSAEIFISLDLRPDYGLHRAAPIKTAEGFQFDQYYLQAPSSIDWEVLPEGRLDGRVTLHAGESIALALANAPGSWHFPTEMRAARAWWESGPPIAGARGRYSAVVQRSVQLIHLMMYRPTGALLAAPTTSLPEKIGGDRNYDYRFVWLRDMAFVILAMLPRGEFLKATKRLLDWFVMSCINPREHVPIMFKIDVAGEIGERLLSHLEGYGGSRPVRVGNEAVEQFQLDAYGELLIAVKLYGEHVGHLERGWWPLLTRLADDLSKRWAQPDWGIWEERAMPRQYLYSKVMTWVGLEAAVELALRFKLPGDADRWKESAAQIRVHIDDHYWNADKGAYVAVAGGEGVDASALLMGLYDYLPINDPRLHATAERIEADLCVDGLVYRRLEDEIAQEVEGSFNLCTLWLVIYWARAGETARARALFDRFLARGNAYQLYSEEIDPATGEFLGNYPQLFVHAALVVAADTLEQGEPAPAPESA